MIAALTTQAFGGPARETSAVHATWND